MKLIQKIEDIIINSLGAKAPVRVDGDGLVTPKSKLASLASTIGNFALALRIGRSATVDQTLDINGVQDDFNFLQRDIGLTTVIEVHGTYQSKSEEETLRAYEQIEQEWRGMFTKAGVMHDWCVYGGDPVTVEKKAADMLEGSRATMNRLGLGLETIIDEKIKVNTKLCRYERVFLCIWVDRRIATTAKDAKTVKGYRDDKQKEIKLAGVEGIDIVPVAPIIEDQVEAITASALQTLRSLNVKAERITCKETIESIRLMTESQTDYNWRARLNEESPIRSKTRNNPHDYGHLLPPSIATQLFPNAVGDLVDTAKMVNYGGKLHGGVVAELACRQAIPFANFHSKMRQLDIPYRLRFTIAGDGLSGVGLIYKQTLNNIVGFTDFTGQNKAFSEAMKSIKYAAQDGSAQPVKFRLCAETWVECNIDSPEYLLEQKKKLQGNVEKLARILQSWGSFETNQMPGDAFGASIATYPALKRLIPTEDTIARLSDLMPLLPISRTATIWDSGAMLLRTRDGKLFPMQPASAKQKEWSEIWVARQRFGKSLAVQVRSMAVITAPGNNNVPFCMTADIGYSSSGLINLLKYGLPKDKRDLVMHQKLSLRPEHSINPMDTQLSCRYPTPSHEGFVVRFLEQLVLDDDEVGNNIIKKILPELVKQAYRNKSDIDGSPNPYRELKNKAIDNALKEFGIPASEGKTTWWQISDAFMKLKEYNLAAIAQRYSMPTIKELAELVKMKGIIPQDFHETKNPSSNLTYVTELALRINSAIDKWPILKQHTRFDLGSARIVALDIAEICGEKGTKEGEKQTAIAYMLTRHLFMSKIAFSRDDLEVKIPRTNKLNIPDFAFEYHKERVLELEKTVKTINFDEIHRAKGNTSTFQQWEQDVREGPKFKYILSFATQSLQEIPDTLFGLCSTKVLMGLTAKDAEIATKTLNLNKELSTFLTNGKRPNEDGSEALYILDTDEGEGPFKAILALTVGKMEVWAYSTTRDDDVLRSALMEKVGLRVALERLVKYFPETTCAKYFDQLNASNKSEQKINYVEEVAELISRDEFDRDDYLNRIKLLN